MSASRTAATAPLVLSVGARCAMAGNALHVAMLARARKIKTRASGMRDAQGRRIDLCLVRDIPDDVVGFDRLAALGAPALREAHDGALALAEDAERRQILSGPLPLFLALPDGDRPDAHPRVRRELPQALSAASGVAIDLARSKTFTAGHAGFALALQAAARALADGQSGIRAALVGGIDSFYEPAVLAWLDREKRRQAPGVRGGFVPGEGAAFLVLTRPGTQDPGPGPLARLLAVETGSSNEPERPRRTGGEDQPPQGMTDVVRRVLASSPKAPGWVLTDVNGEEYRTWEWSSVKRAAIPRAAVEQTFTAELGDVGAASGPLLASIACACFRVACAPSSLSLLALHSDFGLRGSFLLEAITGAPDLEVPPVGTPSAARRVARVARILLERIGSAPRGVARERLSRALDAAWSALGKLEVCEAGDPARLDELAEAIARVEEIKGILAHGKTETSTRPLQILTSIERCLVEAKPSMIDEIVNADAASSARAQRGRAFPAPVRFLASVGVPRLHALPGGNIQPFRWLLAPAPASQDEDEEEPVDKEETRPGPEATKPEEAGAAPPPSETSVERRAIARACMDDIGRLSWLRRAGDSHPWSPSLGRFEQRLLDNLDALVALAHAGLPGAPPGSSPPPVLDLTGEILRYTSESFTDSARAFARAFVLCSIDGEDGIRAAVMALRRSHPTTLQAQREALCLASNPRVGAAMEELCRDEDPRLVCLALDVLRARRQAPFALTVLLLEHPEPEVRCKAALALATAPAREISMTCLERMLEEEIEGAFALALTVSLTCLDARSGAAHARRRLQADLAAPGGLSPPVRCGFLRLLAVAGGASDGELMLRSARSPADIETLGWLGHAVLIDPLIRIMEGAMSSQAGADTWPLRRAAARALHRITGATPGQPSPNASGEPTIVVNPVRWRSYWKEHGHELGMGQKYRFGRPLSVAAILDELDRGEVRHDVRATCALELAVVSPTQQAPWVEDWTARQLTQIAQLRKAFERRRIRDAAAPVTGWSTG